MSLSRLARRNPLPELADGWEGSARGRQTSRRTGGQVGDQLQGPDFPLAPWGFCSPSEHPHDISYAVSSPVIRCTAQEKLLGQRCSGAQRHRHAGFRFMKEGREHRESGVNPISS